MRDAETTFRYVFFSRHGSVIKGLGFSPKKWRTRGQARFSAHLEILQAKMATDATAVYCLGEGAMLPKSKNLTHTAATIPILHPFIY